MLHLLAIEDVTVESFRPYGWLLGKSMPVGGSIPVFSNPDTSFWQEHIFNPGSGETEVLSVAYQNADRAITSLEVHWLTQQAVFPLTGEILQVVASTLDDRSPDEASMRVFRVPVGQGICMRAGCWHTTRVDAQEVKCMMLTRRSTTIDLIAHLNGQSALSESTFAPLTGVYLAATAR
jgi:ureidoglycolate lyase